MTKVIDIWNNFLILYIQLIITHTGYNTPSIINDTN
jgi:hypothetical protein